jgi:rhodanese-related sulfurtransferase
MEDIQADELIEKIESGEDMIIIDVRTPEETKKGKIAGSINMPFDEIEDLIEEKIKDKNTPICLYCLSGSRSIIAAKILESKEYTNVFNLSHGLLEWRIKKLPLV